MLSWLLYFGLIAFGAGLVLAAIAAAVVSRWLLGAAGRWLQDYAESQAQLTAAKVHAITAQSRADAEQAIAAAVNMRTEAEKRGKAHWGAVNASEAITDTLLELVTDAQVLQARLDNALLRAEWIRSGGNPQAPWVEIVRWKNRKADK